MTQVWFPHPFTRTLPVDGKGWGGGEDQRDIFISTIASVEPFAHYRLLLRLHNGDIRIYDCRPLLTSPDFYLLRDPGFFKAVRVDAGGYGISWNDSIDLSEYEVWSKGTAVS